MTVMFSRAAKGEREFAHQQQQYNTLARPDYLFFSRVSKQPAKNRRAWDGPQHVSGGARFFEKDRRWDIPQIFVPNRMGGVLVVLAPVRTMETSD